GNSRVLLGLRHKGAANGFFNGEIEEAQLYDRALGADDVAASARSHGLGITSAAQMLSELTPEEGRERSQFLSELDTSRAALKDVLGTPQCYAANSRQPEMTFVLSRGDVEQKKEQVTAAGLSAVSTLPADFQLNADSPEQER